MTMEELCAIEPRLTRLLEEARAMKDERESVSFCANRVFYAKGSFNEQLSKLVGFDAEILELRSIEAYDAAYDAVYRLLPNCRNCACW